MVTNGQHVLEFQTRTGGPHAQLRLLLSILSVAVASAYAQDPLAA